MAKKNGSRLAFSISTDHLDVDVESENCIICDSEFSFPSIVFTVSSPEKDGSVELQPGCFVCPACILSDTETLKEKAQATAKRHQSKTERLRKEHGPGAEDLEDYELEEDWCDNSDFLNEFCTNLDRSGGVSKIVHRDLAVSIVKRYTHKAA